MFTNRSRGLLALAAGVLVLAACQPSASTSPEPSASAAESVMPSEAASVEPSAVACTLPATGEATVDRAQITGVSIDESADADVLTITFADGTPAYRVDVATPPFLKDPSGLELTVDGSSFLVLTMQGASRVDPNGNPTYSGETEFKPDLVIVQHVVEGGDFEAIATWFIGLKSDVCPTVTTTANELILTFSR